MFYISVRTRTLYKLICVFFEGHTPTGHAPRPRSWSMSVKKFS